MAETVIQAVYFDKPGPQNTRRTLETARKRAKELGIHDILVATTMRIQGFWPPGCSRATTWW